MSTLVPVLLTEMLLAMLAVVTGKGRREGRENTRERESGRKGRERKNSKGEGKK